MPFVCVVWKCGVCSCLGDGGGTYDCTCTEARRGLWESGSITAHLIPLRQSLSQNLELGWKPISPRNPPVSDLHCTGLACVPSNTQDFSVGFGDPYADLNENEDMATPSYV